jgi:hypothetical protein
MLTFTKALCASILLAILCGCGPSNLALKSDFWQNKERKLGVAVAKPPIAATHQAGGGLLDRAIAKAAIGSLEAHFEKLDSSGFEDVGLRFVENLRTRGFNVTHVSKPVDLEKLKEFVPTSSGNYHERDLRMLAADENIDALILLSIDRWGTTRKYYGFIPLESPKPFCVGKGELVNLRTNGLEWSAEMTEEEAKMDVEGEWDKPPFFENLTKVLYKTVNRAKVYLENSFFGTKLGTASSASEPLTEGGVWNRSAISGSLGYGFYSPSDQIRFDWLDEGTFGGLGIEARVLFNTTMMDSRLRLGAEYALQTLASEPSGGSYEWSYYGVPVGTTAATNEFLGHSIQGIADFKLANIQTATLYGAVGLGVLFFSGAKDRVEYVPPPSPGSPSSAYYSYVPFVQSSGPSTEPAGSARLYVTIPVARSITVDPAVRVLQSFGNEKIFYTQLSVGASYIW